MAVTRVQQNIGTAGNATSFTITLGSTPTNGNYLYCAVGLDSNTNAVTSITGGGVTWALLRRSNSGGSDAVEIWGGTAAVSGASSGVITVNHAKQNTHGWAGEFSGITSGATDVTGGGGGTSTTLNAPDVTTTNAADLMICAGSTTNIIPSAGPTNSFTANTNSAGGSTNGFVFSAWKELSATETTSTDWTITSGTWNAVTVAIKVSTGAATNSNFLMFMMNQR
jgi:hypothetical protein